MNLNMTKNKSLTPFQRVVVIQTVNERGYCGYRENHRSGAFNVNVPTQLSHVSIYSQISVFYMPEISKNPF